MKLPSDISYIGVNDHEIDLFEGQYVVPNGMSYNSYVITDDKIAVMDAVDKHFAAEWLGNLAAALNGRQPDYLVVQHMEPDHSGSITDFLQAYPDVQVVGNAKTFLIMDNFIGKDVATNRLEVKDGDVLQLGKHSLRFVFAPMVHWPEVMVSYDSYAQALFSADGFGKFGALDAEEEWDCEARRYYFGIVGKYGVSVQNLLKKASAFDIRTICPLHGPVLDENLSHYLDLYNVWSSYGTESDGVCICYTSVYGHTRQAVELLRDELIANGCSKVSVADLARDDMAEAVEDAFRYGKLVLASTTYNASVFPFMHDFVTRLAEHNFQNKRVVIIENGSWAPMAAKTITNLLAPCKNITFDGTVTILSALTSDNRRQISALAKKLCE